jgi:hypothetical protein
MARRDFRVAMLLVLASGIVPPGHTQSAAAQKSTSTPAVQQDLNDILQSKVKAEWEAFKKKDKNAYAELLADDFVAVEDDGDGARNKIHVTNEVAASNIQSYSLSFFKCLPLSPDSAFVTYEITMEFPAKSVNRYKRLLVGELWLKRDGQWKARHYQETRVR